MKTITLTKGYVAIVDDADYPEVAQFKWNALTLKNGKVYAYRTLPNPERGAEYMHRRIMGLGRGDRREVDHENGNGLDNQRHNMRVCAHRQNLCNQRKQDNRSSRFKGVCWFTKKNKWYAGIKVNQKRINLGLHIKEEDAARAYDAAAIMHFGEFANLNFPTGSQSCA